MKRIRQKSSRSTKRSLRAAIPAALLTVSLAVPAPAEANIHSTAHSFHVVRRDTNNTLVALGDSITYGYNLGDNKAPSSLAFPYLVAKKENLQVSDLGVPGWTSSDLLNALRTDANMQNALKQAAVITLDIGSNDILHQAGSLLSQVASSGSVSLTDDEKARLMAAIQGFQENLPQIVTEIRKLTSAPITLTNLYDPIPDMSPIHPIAEQLIAQENQSIMNEAAQTGLSMADVYSAFNHKQMTLVRVLQLDVHPTKTGQQAIATTVEAAIEKPRAFTPAFFATAPTGTTVYAQPDDTSTAIYTLHGIEGDIVSGVQDSWVEVTTGDNQTGYIPIDKVNLLLRPNGNYTFQTFKGSVKAGTIVNVRGGTARSYVLNGVPYAPLSFLTKAAGARSSWDNVHREVQVSTRLGSVSSGAGSGAGSTTSSGTTSGTTTGTKTPSSGSGWTLKFHFGTKAQKADIRTEGILLSVDGEPAALSHEVVMIGGVVYVPAADFGKSLGGVSTVSAGDLQLLFAVDS